MYCSKCGKENLDSAKFCVSCGSAIAVARRANSSDPQVVSENQYISMAASADSVATVKKKRLNIVPLIIIGIVAAIIIALCATGLLTTASKDTSDDFMNPSNEVFYDSDNGETEVVTHSYEVFYDEDNDKTHFVVDGIVLKPAINGEFGPYERYGQVIVSDSDGMLRLVRSQDNDLYQVKDGSLEWIASDVLTAFTTSDGNTFCYASKNGLYLRDWESDDASLISNDAINYLNVLLSPDGKSVLYEVAVTNDVDDYELWLYNNGNKAKIVSGGVHGLAISNGGLDIYYYDRNNEAIFYTSSGSDEKTRVVDGIGQVQVLNNSHTQLIYNDFAGYDNLGAIFIENGKVIANHEGQFWFVRLAETTHFAGSNLEKLTERLYWFVNNDLSYELYYLNREHEFEKIVVGASAFFHDNKTLIYIKDSNLYRTENFFENDCESVSSGVNFFASTKNGDIIYYINDDNELCALKKDGEREKIADNVSSITLSHDDILFYVSDVSNNLGTLYACTDENDKEWIADSVYYHLKSYSNVTMYMSAIENHAEIDYSKIYARGNIYVAKSGKEFESILQGVSFSYGLS